MIGQSYAVAPDTIGTFVGGNAGSYAYTSADRFVYCMIKKFFPRQHVSAFVSISFAALVPAIGCCTLCCVAVLAEMTRTIRETWLIPRPFARRSLSCSFRPPVIEPD